MTLATTIRVNATTPFPSQVLGSGGLKISKANGIFTISPDFASLPLISSASDLINKRAWVFDNATQTYSQMSLQAVVDAGFLGRMFTSTGQALTSAGSLTLAHGLGIVPQLVQFRIKCLTGELNFSVGDEVPVNPGPDDNNVNGRGFSVVLDSTNINIRFTSQANIFLLLNKTTGLGSVATNANWQLIARAWA